MDERLGRADGDTQNLSNLSMPIALDVVQKEGGARGRGELSDGALEL